ncbi:MAG TPA: DinB family protein [Bryobacteraceae bacterium]
MKTILTLSLTAVFAAGALQAQNPFSTDTKNAYNGIKNTLTRAAEEMPEADYSFSTVPGKTRTYGEIISHIADIQMVLCGLVKGEQKQPSAEKTKKTKAEASAALKESFDYCDSVYNSLTDADAATMVKMFGRDQTKLGVLNFNIAHDNEMYGTAVAYLRMKDLVPPSSQRRR